MQLGKTIKSVSGKTMKTAGTVGKAAGAIGLGLLYVLAESSSYDPDDHCYDRGSIDITELKSKGGYSRKAFFLLDQKDYSSYGRMREKLFDKIIQSEKNYKYASYRSWDEEETELCTNALVYVADMLDHGKMMNEIADGLSLKPGTVMAICKFFNDIDDEDIE